jgi:hypothetical protein
MSTNFIDVSRQMSAEDIEDHFTRTNAANTRWTHLEMRRREISRMTTALVDDLEQFPSRHSSDSFALYSGVLRTFCIYQREIERQKDGVPMSADWVATLVDALNQATEQRHAITLLIPGLAALDVSKRTNDPDATAYKVLIAAIEQFKTTAYKFLDEPEATQEQQS